MEAKELMINNLFIKTYFDGRRKVERATGATLNMCEEYFESVEPIPITPEIVARNAYKDPEVPDGWIFGNLIGMIWEADHLDCGIQLYYVHQLQQFLNLCGLKELANNFKIE